MTERNDPAEQMLAVLDVLWEELQWRTTEGEPATEVPIPPSEDEINAALWQIHELVFAMAGELSNTYDLLERMLHENQERQSVHNILFGPDGEKL